MSKKTRKISKNNFNINKILLIIFTIVFIASVLFSSTLKDLTGKTFYEDKNLSEAYEADTDGFVVFGVYSMGNNRNVRLRGYTGSTNDPTTIRASAAGIGYRTNSEHPTESSATMPVKEGDWWRVKSWGSDENIFIYWVSTPGMITGDWFEADIKDLQTYEARTDGFVVFGVYNIGNDRNIRLRGFTDSTQNPTTIRASASGTAVANVDYPIESSATMPVKKGDNWRVTRPTNVGGGPGKIFIYWVSTPGMITDDDEFEKKDYNRVYYDAETDGFVVFGIHGISNNRNIRLRGFTDSTQNPTTIRASAAGKAWANVDLPIESTATMLVKKGDNWRVTLPTNRGSGPVKIFVYWVSIPPTCSDHNEDPTACVAAGCEYDTDGTCSAIAIIAICSDHNEDPTACVAAGCEYDTTEDTCFTPECTSNPDCSGSTPACDTTHKICVECTYSEDSACAITGEICDTGSSSSTYQTCIPECANNPDCSGSTPVCDTGTCVECTSVYSQKCTADETCYGNVCTEGCFSDNDCVTTTKPACDIIHDICVECTTATVDDDCATDEVCYGNICVECAGNADCTAPDTGCDVNTNTCLAKCTLDADCTGPGLEKCYNGLCVPGCLSSAGCSDPTSICQPTDDICVQCIVDSHCSDPIKTECNANYICIEATTCSPTQQKINVNTYCDANGNRQPVKQLNERCTEKWQCPGDTCYAVTGNIKRCQHYDTVNNIVCGMPSTDLTGSLLALYTALCGT